MRSGLCFTLFFALSLGACTSGDDPATQFPVDSATASPGAHPSITTSFEPRTRSEGSRFVLPVTFPDGTTAELAYRPKLALHDMVIRPYGSGCVGRACRDFWIFHGPVSEALARLGDAEALSEYPDGQGGSVSLWRVPKNPDYLGFQLGSWAVLVYDYRGSGSMGDALRAEWARSLRGVDSPDGFLLIQESGRLDLATAGEHAGPELQFWAEAGGFQSILLFAGRCEPTPPDEIERDDIGETGWFSSWCDVSGKMTVHVYGDDDESLIDEIKDGLEIRDVQIAN